MEQEENPAFWRTITDELNQSVHVLSKEQFELIRKIRNRQYISDKIKNTNYAFELKQDIHPMSSAPIPKRRFQPSKWERLKIKKIVKAMKLGWLKPKAPEEKKDKVEEFFKDVQDTWVYNPNEKQGGLQKLGAPQMNLPGNEKSFNPPAEYFDDKIEPLTNMRNLEATDEIIKD